jgi:hypothetical protein
LLEKVCPVNGSADGATGVQQMQDTEQELEEITVQLAARLRDLLGLTFGPRGAHARLGNWEMALDHQLFGWDPTIHNVQGRLILPFTLPRIGANPDPDETNDIPF